VRYRCRHCGRTEWRGLFPEPASYLRYAVFHGAALGVCGIATKLVLARFGLPTSGWTGGPVSLLVCGALMLGFYGVAIAAEAFAVGSRRCRSCENRGLRLA
jgi:hypothetical protein